MRSVSTIISPRAQLIRQTLGFILENASAFSIPRVWSVAGMCTVIKSASRYTRSTSVTRSMPSSWARASLEKGSYASTRMPKAKARRATSPPMRPSPRIPKVFPITSVPWNCLRSHLPAAIEACAWGTLRARLMSIVKASSAVETVLPPGVFMTTTPRCVAASTSTLSTPTPARPTTFSWVAAAITLLVTFVSERTTMAVTSDTSGNNSASESRFGRTVTLNSGRCCSSAIPFGEMGSQTSTFISSRECKVGAGGGQSMAKPGATERLTKSLTM